MNYSIALDGASTRTDAHQKKSDHIMLMSSGSTTVPLPKAIDAEQKSYVSAQGGRVSYYVDPQATGRPLVLIHSINAAPSAFEMKPLFTYYRTTRPVYALDLPGFGFSERSQRAYSPALYVNTIIEFLDRVVGQAADVIALSLGCEFAAMAAQARPDRFCSLTLITPTGLGQPRSISKSTSDRIYKTVTFPLWNQALFDLLTVRPSISYFSGKSFAGPTPAEFIDYAYQTSHQPGARIAPFYFLSGQLFTWDVREKTYEKLTTPTLVLYDRDPNVQFDLLPQVLAHNPNWRAERIPGTMGLPHWEKLPETTAVLTSFWAQQA